MACMRWAVPLALLLAASVPAAVAGDDGTASLREQLSVLREELAAQRELIDAQRAELVATQARRLAEETSLTEKVSALEKKDSSMEGAMDSAWLILCGALVMFMHAGFAMLETGCCRSKNASNVLMKNLVNVCFGTIGWWALGWAFAYGGPNNDEGKLANGFIGARQFFGMGFTSGGNGKIEPLAEDATTTPMLSWFFQWAFCTAGATIVSGGVAERLQSPTYAAFAFFMTSFIYPVVVAWTWGYGWLSSLFGVGYMDFAGSGVVHLTGGISALAGTYVLGPREGRFERPEEFESHNVPLVVLGTFALWFGWYGFNPGSTLGMHSKETGALAAQVAMNTTLAAASCGIVVFVLRYFLTHKYEVGALCNGILSGLVSITAGCGNVESGSAVAIGVIGAFVYVASSMALQRCKIDDPVDASCVHGACGAWGLIATALFDWGKGFDYYHGWGGWGCTEGTDGCMRGAGGKALGVQIVMILAIVAWAGTLSGACFLVLKKLNLLRIDEETEAVGLDEKKHSPSKAYALGEAAISSPSKSFTSGGAGHNAVV